MLDRFISEILERLYFSQSLTKEESNHLIIDLSKHFEGLNDNQRLVYLLQENPYDNFRNPLSSAIINKNGELFKNICSLISDDEKRFFLINHSLKKVHFNSLSSSTELLGNILSLLNDEQKISLLTDFKDYEGNDLFIRLIHEEKNDLIEFILDSFSDKNKFRFIEESLNEVGDNALLHAIKLSKYKSLKVILDSLCDDDKIKLITQSTDIAGSNAFFYAVKTNKFEISKTILDSFEDYNKKESLIKIIDQTDQIDAYFRALLNTNYEFSELILKHILDDRKSSFIFGEDLQNSSKRTECLIKILSSNSSLNPEKFLSLLIFDNDSSPHGEILNDALSNYAMLSLIANESEFSFSSKKIIAIIKSHLTEIQSHHPNNPLIKIYDEIFNKFGTHQPIVGRDKNRLFVYYTDIPRHASYFIFHVDENDHLNKISYCDGNIVDHHKQLLNAYRRDDGKLIINMYSVINYELSTPTLFSEEFANKFIEKNCRGKNFLEFYEHLKNPHIKFNGLRSEISSITYEIPKQTQKRGNCSLKANNILACWILNQQDSNYDFSWDDTSKLKTGRGYEAYKQFKDRLAEQARNKLSKYFFELQKVDSENLAPVKIEILNLIKEALKSRLELSEMHLMAKVERELKNFHIGSSPSLASASTVSQSRSH